MRRSMLEVQVEVLRAINRGIVKPTRIMYASNINWIPLTKILKMLVNQKAIEMKPNNSRDEYCITPKGKMILQYYDMSTSMLMGKMRVSPSDLL